jgi:hypothetical protein
VYKGGSTPVEANTICYRKRIARIDNKKTEVVSKTERRRGDFSRDEGTKPRRVGREKGKGRGEGDDGIKGEGEAQR